MADFAMVTARMATGAALAGPGDVAQLTAAGITHVVDCRAEYDDAPLFAGAAMAYLWDGTGDDGAAKPASWFAAALRFALPAVAQPKTKVLFHCSAGVNRGPSMCYAALRALGWPPLPAEYAVRAARPQAALAYARDADAAVAYLGYT